MAYSRKVEESVLVAIFGYTRPGIKNKCIQFQNWEDNKCRLYKEVEETIDFNT